VPPFHRLTFGPGSMWSARFTADGRTVVYGARGEGGPFKVFTARTEDAVPQPLPLPAADILAVSPDGVELAIALNRRPGPVTSSFNTLATVPLGGGEPREVARDVQSADYSPDGRLAIVRYVAGRTRLEFPIGHVLYEAEALAGVRVSPDGKRLALLEGDHTTAHLLLLDLAGRKTVLGEEKRTAVDLAWSPRGDELWFGSWRDDDAVLQAVDLAGRTRTMAALPGWAHITDISREGRVLMIHSERGGSGLRCLAPGEQSERELSTLGDPGVAMLSADEKLLLYSDQGPGGKAWTYVRKTDGSAGAVRLGPGTALAPSGGRRFALPAPAAGGDVILPGGLGESRTLDATVGKCGFFGGWFPDGRRVLLNCRGEGDRATRAYVQPVDGSASRALTPEGTECRLLSPGGDLAAC